MILNYHNAPPKPSYLRSILLACAIAIPTDAALPIWPVLHRGKWESSFDNGPLWQSLLALPHHGNIPLLFLTNLLITLAIATAIGTLIAYARAYDASKSTDSPAVPLLPPSAHSPLN